MLKLGRKVKTFTITCSDDHPDIEYSQRALSFFKALLHTDIEESHWFVRPNLTGDDLVAAFYSTITNNTDSIIAGDGIDEFLCGYYQHQANPIEETYFDFMRRLQSEQLEPLDKNSSKVKVYLPYLDERVTSLLWQIPISEKVDINERKKITNQLARMAGIPEFIIERKKYGFATPATKSKATV
jgi:asparagine synthetase B (glutamine-hydrolysing)